MSSLEAECFSDLQGASSHAFVQIRNRILKLWFEDPKKQLTQELAVQKMEVIVILYNFIIKEYKLIFECSGLAVVVV